MIHSYSEQIVAIQKARTALWNILEFGNSALTNNVSECKEVIDGLNTSGSTIAALNLSDPYKEIERLTEWKESMLKLWGPVIDWMQEKSNLGLGKDISVEVLKRVQEYESLKQKLKEANDIIAHYADVNQNQ